jgi:hypothetical protein
MEYWKEFALDNQSDLQSFQHSNTPILQYSSLVVAGQTRQCYTGFGCDS